MRSWALITLLGTIAFSGSARDLGKPRNAVLSGSPPVAGFTRQNGDLDPAPLNGKNGNILQNLPGYSRQRLWFARGVIPTPDQGGPKFGMCPEPEPSAVGLFHSQFEHIQDIQPIGDWSQGAAYIAVAHSQHRFGHLFILKTTNVVAAPNEHEIYGLNMGSLGGDGAGVWYRRFDSQAVEGVYNHPGDLAAVGHILLVIAENWPGSSLFGVTCSLERAPDPATGKFTEDAILFYDVAQPENPVYLGKLRASELPVPAQEIADMNAMRIGDRYFLVIGGQWFESETLLPDPKSWQVTRRTLLPAGTAKPGYGSFITAHSPDTGLEETWLLNMDSSKYSVHPVVADPSFLYFPDVDIEYEIDEGNLRPIRTADFRRLQVQNGVHVSRRGRMSYLSCAGGFGVEAKYLDLVPYIGSLGHDVLDIEVHAIHYATDNEVVWPAGFEVLPRLDALADARGWQSEPYYSTVQSADVDGDGRDEILARAAVGLVAWTFSGNSWDPLPGSIPFSDPAWAAPQYYRTIKTADLDGDGRAEVYARSAAGIGVWKHDGTQWNALPGILPLTDASGWANPEYYTTLQAANIDGLPGDELLGRAATGMFAWKYQSPGWQMLPGVLPFSDAAGWKNAAYYATIQSTDLDNDGVAEVFARTAAGIIAFRHSGTDWIRLPGEFPLTDAQGWDRPRHYETIRSGDLDGDGRSEILARGAEGLTAWEYRDAAWKPKIPTLLPLTDAAGWDERRYFSTMRVADLDGDGRDELLARGKYGLLVYRLQGTQWETLPSYLNYADRYGWDAVAYFGTLQTANVDGKPGREILARSAAGLEVRKLRPNPLLTSNPNRSLTVVAAPAQPATLVWDDFADFVVVEQSGKATGEAWVALEGQPTRRNGRWELPLPTTSAAHRFYRLRVP